MLVSKLHTILYARKGRLSPDFESLWYNMSKSENIWGGNFYRTWTVKHSEIRKVYCYNSEIFTIPGGNLRSAQYCPSTDCRSPSTGVCTAPSLGQSWPVMHGLLRVQYWRQVPILYCQTTGILKSFLYHRLSTASMVEPTFRQYWVNSDYLYWSTVLGQYYTGGELWRNTEISTWDNSANQGRGDVPVAEQLIISMLKYQYGQLK